MSIIVRHCEPTPFSFCSQCSSVKSSTDLILPSSSISSINFFAYFWLPPITLANWLWSGTLPPLCALISQYYYSNSVLWAVVYSQPRRYSLPWVLYSSPVLYIFALPVLERGSGVMVSYQRGECLWNVCMKIISDLTIFQTGWIKLEDSVKRMVSALTLAR